MKKVLYIDMLFHIKTKSTHFVVELLEKEFEVEKVYLDATKSDGVQIDKIEKRIVSQKYDYLVLFQLMPLADFLAELSFDRGIFFPMYDSAVGLTIEDWEPYRSFTIINFCKTLHEFLDENGFCSRYIQYFPKPQPITNEGREDSLFFWQRTNQIHINQCLALCENLHLKDVHIHKAIDPNCYYIPPHKKFSYFFNYSKWFEKKQDLIDKIEESAYYVAPRKYEGIGMSFLDAMAKGRCVIAPNYPTMNEYIQDGVTGILYDYEKPKPINEVDVREIQRNTYRYIEEGYRKWEEEKYKIIGWIEEEQEQEKHICKLPVKETSKLDVVPKGELEKMQQYYTLLWKWLLLKERNVSLEKYFFDNGIKHIAVYGYSEVASRLEEELENTSVVIDYFIDKSSKMTDSGMMTVNPKEDIPKVDMIVVTPVFYFETIYSDLRQKINVPIMSLREIIDVLMEEL